MAEYYTDQIKVIMKAYTQEEVAEILGVTGKSVSNYVAGERPGKKIIGKITEVYEKLRDNDYKRLPSGVFVTKEKRGMITPESVLLQVLLQEFADFKAQKEGREPDDIVKEIESKAKLILKVAGKG